MIFVTKNDVYNVPGISDRLLGYYRDFFSLPIVEITFIKMSEGWSSRSRWNGHQPKRERIFAVADDSASCTCAQDINSAKMAALLS